jgi:hypothetical protein
MWCRGRRRWRWWWCGQQQPDRRGWGGPARRPAIFRCAWRRAGHLRHGRAVQALRSRNEEVFVSWPQLQAWR